MDLNFDLDTIKDYGSKVTDRIKRFQFGNKAQLAFMEDFYVLINDGIPANRAIEMMTHVTQGLTREVALSVSQKIAEGQPLADGMRDWFNSNIVEIVRVGEEGGALNESVRSGINTLTQRSSMLGGFLAAVSYPLFVIIMACAVIVYLNNSILPEFRVIKPENLWPQAGRDLVNLANIIESWWWTVILFIFSFILIMRQLMNNYTGDFRKLLDKVPPFSMYRRMVAARFMETLGLLVANGVVFKQALRVMQTQASPYLGSHIMIMEHQLGMGTGNIADVIDTGLIDQQDILRLHVMAEVKGFEHGLVRMGVRGSEQSTQMIKFISKIVGGALLAVGAVLILLIIRGIYLTGMSMGTGV